MDEQEDQRYGTDCRGDELPQELAPRQSRLKRIQEAKKALEAEDKEAAQQAQKQSEQEDSKNDDKPKRGRKPKAISDIPADNKQYNFTDPQSKIMKVNDKGWEQCGNVQAAVDSNKQIIVACDVTTQSNDKQQFKPMLQKAQENVGEDKTIKAASADSSYYSESNVKYAQGKKIDAYIATKKIKHNDPGKERIYYLKKFGDKYGGKICFVKYGMGTPESSQEVDHLANNKNRFFFSGGTSNRDYQTLVKAFEGLDKRLKIACFPRDIKGLEIPPNVEVLHDVFGADFEDYMVKAFAILISLDDPNVSAGQLVLLNAMSSGKPIIATRDAGAEDYISEDCAILIAPHSSNDIRQAVKRLVAHNDYLFQIGYKAMQSYKDNFTIEKLGKRVSTVLYNKHK